MNKRYALKYFYIGNKRYYGSQRQKEKITIEECIIQALKEGNYITSVRNAKLEVASRTDKYVSARGAVLTFKTKKKPIPMEINSFLPRDIGVWAMAEVDNDFLSRYNAIYRHYKYIYSLVKINRYELEIDFHLLKKAVNDLKGRKDFKNFYKRGKDKEKTIRDMDEAAVSINNQFVIFDFKSRAFLRQQIRRMVQKVLDVARGRTTYEEYLKLFDSSKDFSYQPAEPDGLILWNIEYGDSIPFKIDERAYKYMKQYFIEQKRQLSIKKKLFSLLEQDNLSQE